MSRQNLCVCCLSATTVLLLICLTKADDSVTNEAGIPVLILQGEFSNISKARMHWHKIIGPSIDPTVIFERIDYNGDKVLSVDEMKAEMEGFEDDPKEDRQADGVYLAQELVQGLAALNPNLLIDGSCTMCPISWTRFTHFVLETAAGIQAQHNRKTALI